MAKLVIQNSKPSIVWINSELIEEKIGGQYYSAEYIHYENILRNNKLVNFGDVICEYNGGPMGFQLHSYDYATEGIPVLRTKDLSELTVEFNDPIFISKEKHEELKSSKTYPGDIIISKTGQIGVVAVVPFNVKEANLNQALCNVRVKEEVIDNYFLAVFLNSKYGQYQFIRQGEGKAVQNGLTKDEILALEIPVISPQISKYIGDKVRKAKELREEAKRLLNDIENMISQLFKFCYEKKRKGNFVNNQILSEDRLDADYYSVENIEAQKRILQFSNLKKIKDIAYITDGDHGKPEFKDSGVLFIRNKNVRQYLINLDDVVYIDKAYEDKYLKSSKLEFEDILLTKIGTIGECAVYTENEGNLNANSALIRIKDKYFVSPYYLCAILNSSIYNIILNKESGGGVQAALSLSRLGEIIVPILGRDVQIEIENMLKQYMKDKENIQKLMVEAKQDVEDLIEGNFDMSKIKETN